MPEIAIQTEIDPTQFFNAKINELTGQIEILKKITETMVDSNLKNSRFILEHELKIAQAKLAQDRVNARRQIETRKELEKSNDALKKNLENAEVKIQEQAQIAHIKIGVLLAQLKHAEEELKRLKEENKQWQQRSTILGREALYQGFSTSRTKSLDALRRELNSLISTPGFFAARPFSKNHVIAARKPAFR